MKRPPRHRAWTGPAVQESALDDRAIEAGPRHSPPATGSPRLLRTITSTWLRSRYPRAYEVRNDRLEATHSGWRRDQIEHHSRNLFSLIILGIFDLFSIITS